MSKWIKIGIASFAVVSVLALTAVLLSTSVLAQDSPPAATEDLPPFPGRGVGPLGGQAGLEAAAEMLGMTAETLKAELWAGTNMADIAAEKGVDLVELHAAVRAAVEAAQGEAMRAAIDEALQAGTITQENADWLLEGVEKGFIPGFGFRRGGGRGVFHGGGMFADSLFQDPTAP